MLNYIQNNIKQIFKKHHLFSLLCVLAICFFLPVFTYTHNIAENPSYFDLFKPTVILTLYALVFMIVGMLYRLSFDKTIFFSMMGMLVVINYMSIEKALLNLWKNANFWHITPIILVTLLWCAVFLVYCSRKYDSIPFYKLNYILGVVFGMLILVNFIFCVPKLLRSTSEEQNSVHTPFEQSQPVEISANSTIGTDLHPSDIYFIILDEYANSDLLKEYTGFDNFEFIDWLKEKGFNYSSNSVSTVAETRFSTGNTLFYNNIFKEGKTSLVEWQRIIDTQAPLIQQMKNNGYYCIFSSPLPQMQNSQSKKLADKTFNILDASGFDLNQIALAQTLHNRIFPDTGKIRYNNFLDFFDRYEEYFALRENVEKRFVWAHLLTPHQPFLFAEDGSMNNADNFNNWDDKSIYIGQMKYINKRLKNIITGLINQNPDCVILIQSDHNTRQWVQKQEEGKIIFNMLYYKGQVLDIEGMSGLNTVRMLLNKIFGMNLEMLEDNYVEKQI